MMPVDSLVLETNAICRMAEEDARAAQAPPIILAASMSNSGGE